MEDLLDEVSVSEENDDEISVETLIESTGEDLLEDVVDDVVKEVVERVGEEEVLNATRERKETNQSRRVGFNSQRMKELTKRVTSRP